MNSTGHTTLAVDIPPKWRNLVQNDEYDTLYEECLLATETGQWLHKHLKSLTTEVLGKGDFSLELMLAKRQGPQDEEDEGIWHDDASRDLAFSLSLNESPQTIVGGELGLRRKQNPQEISFIETQPWGTMLVFHTGKKGWDHKITRVTSGNRLVLVGWLTLLP